MAHVFNITVSLQIGGQYWKTQVNTSVMNKRLTPLTQSCCPSVVHSVNQRVFGEHALLWFLVNWISFWRTVIIKDSSSSKHFGLEVWFVSCLAMGQKCKKQLGLYLVICLHASGAHFRNNSKGPIHFVPPAMKWMWESGCYFHSARHLLFI